MDQAKRAAQLLIQGRVATQADVDSGSCVFFIPDERSKPYQFDRLLPIPARLTSEHEIDGMPPNAEILIVQAEIGDTNDVLLGFLTKDLVEGICQLAEVEVL